MDLFVDCRAPPTPPAAALGWIGVDSMKLGEHWAKCQRLETRSIPFISVLFSGVRASSHAKRDRGIQKPHHFSSHSYLNHDSSCRRVWERSGEPKIVAPTYFFTHEGTTYLVFASVFSLVRSTITRRGSPSSPFSKNLAVPEMSSMPSRCSWSRTTPVSLIST